ncbi:MAG: hypothetical protein B6I22_07690 [Desulfobacteraceae bacterium 4572_123]|nr:MAG: hypothetical protein B6I22_07690 [Desulfobacteraceae bacterium 4572_123]
MPVSKKTTCPFTGQSPESDIGGSLMKKTGIIADSHGHVGRLSDAIAFLKKQNCLSIYHLGDICDSTSPQTADACVSLMMGNKIMAVKGNNDHVISLNESGHAGYPVSTASVNYLRNLPLLLKDGNLLFTHSLPFVEELGLSSMVGTMIPENISRFFTDYPATILFRGHGHSPEIIRPENRNFSRTPLIPGQKFNLNPTSPCVFTCGALTDGHCLILEPDYSLACLCF